MTEQSDTTEELNLNVFIEDAMDAPAILIQELILLSEIESVLEVWEVTRHRRKAKNYVILFKNNSHLCTCLGLMQCALVCRHFFQVMSISKCAAFHIMLISKRWYTNEKQIEPEIQVWKHPFIIGLDNNSNSDTSVQQSFPDLSFNSPNISFDDVHTKINYRKSYATVSELSKKAIQTSLDAGSSAIKEFENLMNGFITKYAPRKKKKLFLKRISSDDFVAVEDLIVSAKRGAPRKKRLKGSHKFENKNKFNTRQHSEMRTARKPTQCQQC
ncbi:hypothetical protein C2G38_2311893 [Gigaspora rosea]|uniref:SWIM-type domain-containing protein n=1 Tax=Gigaspora rosea TaxID=44941 RepID=A0A397V766_9GLOM|nr:hypothetical protein C2G38_2311893 [Gigaspora rosea]